MFEIENCYRIIFEAMLEDSIFRCIAEKIEQYTKAGTAFVSGTGKVLACSAVCADLFPASAGMGHLTSEDYMAMRARKEIAGRSWCVTPVYGGKMAIGYVILVYEQKEEEGLFLELGEILVENLKRYFEEEQKQYVFCQPLKEHMTGFLLFEEGPAVRSEEWKFPEGKYIVMLICKCDGRAEEISAFLRSIWKCMQIYEEKEEIYVLLYQVKEQDASFLYGSVAEKKRKCCISEMFSDLSLCGNKKRILKRISRVEDSGEKSVVRREKEWSLQGMYTYAAALMEKAWLRDYSIERLLFEDEKNHTELYRTLKTYLLCENNVTVASKSLHIHRNTLVYRLKQIKDCIDLDTNDYEVCRELLACIMMYDVAGQSIRSRTDYED